MCTKSQNDFSKISKEIVKCQHFSKEPLIPILKDMSLVIRTVLDLSKLKKKTKPHHNRNATF